MSSLSTPLPFVQLATPGTLLNKLRTDEEAFFTIGLGTIEDSGKRFDHFMPVPIALADGIKKGLTSLLREEKLCHRGQAYARISKDLLHWLRNGGDLPTIKFVAEKPKGFWDVYAGHVNFKNGEFWFPGEPRGSLLKVVRKSAKEPMVGKDQDDQSSEYYMTIGSGGLDAASLREDSSLAPFSLEEARTLPVTNNACNGEPIKPPFRDRSFVVLAMGREGDEDTKRQDIMPIPADHLLILKGAMKVLLSTAKVGNTEPVWISLDGISFTDWFNDSEPFVSKNILKLHLRKPTDFHDSHALNIFYQGRRWFIEEDRAARATAKNPSKSTGSFVSREPWSFA